ncbi:hypothetical protein [Mesomycoplasma ovipneumoniae]|nr:hypothetical protein [Mesomycoplasma ovipneumoniae]WNM16808.1 hypothetical protein RNM19_01590 [Mesomycoplasma ovipneumoniae]
MKLITPLKRRDNSTQKREMLEKLKDDRTEILVKLLDQVEWRTNIKIF